MTSRATLSDLSCKLTFTSKKVIEVIEVPTGGCGLSVGGNFISGVGVLVLEVQTVVQVLTIKICMSCSVHF